MAPCKLIRSFKEDNSAFMSCILRVNVYTPGWQKTVREVLSSSRGVRSFKMDEFGIVHVSGLIDPKLLMKKLGKAGRRAELRWFQYGQCSSNLFLSNHDNPYGHRMSSYDEYGRYFPFRQAFQDACLESSYAHAPRLTATPVSFESYAHAPRLTATPVSFERSGCCTIM